MRHARMTASIPVVVSAAMSITALQTIVSRNVDPLEAAVVSVTKFKAGDAYNVIPQTATLGGTVRTLSEPVRDLCEARVRAIVEKSAPPSAPRRTSTTAAATRSPCNTPSKTTFMASRCGGGGGRGRGRHRLPPVMGAEDFSYMLERGPAPTSSSATATPPASTTRPTTSTTRQSPTVSHCGSG